MKTATLAIPIRRVDFSDTSQIVSFFTREGGVIDGIAKGVYREKNAFQGPFDLVTLARIEYIERRCGEALAIITEATQIEGYRGVRRRWERHAAASHVVEFLRAVATPGAPTPGLFDLSRWTFRNLAAAATPVELARTLGEFEMQSFRTLGMSADIRSCGDCGRSWGQEDRAVFFCPELAGVLCRSCRNGNPARRGLMVSGRVIRHLNALARFPEDPAGTGPPTAAAAPEDALSGAQRRELRRALGQLREALLERRLRTLEFTAPFF